MRCDSDENVQVENVCVICFSMICRLFYIVEECNATSAVFCEETAAEVILCGARVSACLLFFLLVFNVSPQCGFPDQGSLLPT